MIRSASAIRSATLAGLAACVVGTVARAQIQGETSLLAVPTARVAPAGTPSFAVGVLSARSDGGRATRVPVALGLAAGTRLELGVRLDDSRPPGGAADTTSARVVVKWQAIAGAAGWRVALAGLGARPVGGDSGRVRYGAGVRATREGFGMGWSAFVDSWSGGGVEAGAAVERRLAAIGALSLEARAGDAPGLLGLIGLRRAFLGGVNGFLAAGFERRGARTYPLIAVALGVAPREAYFQPRARPVASSAEAPDRRELRDLPSLSAALAAEEASVARARERREFLGAQLVVPRPAPADSLLLGRIAVGFDDADSTGDGLTADGAARLSAVARQAPCAVTVRPATGADPGRARQQVRTLRRALAILGVDPARVIVGRGLSSDGAATVEVGRVPPGGCPTP
jgi:hypothetical protein